jgi:endonuclease/exonuclease/phosphatase (EEP) superfamily protein YafD
MGGEGESPAKEEGASKPEAAAPPMRWLTGLVGLYVGGVLAVTVCLAFLVDRFWPATVLAYLPRWLVALPGAPLALLCAAVRRWKHFGAVALCLALAPFTVGDYEIPAMACGQGRPDAAIRLLTQNALRRSLKEPWLADLVEREKLDLVLVQECDVRDLPGGEVDPVVSVTSPIPGFTLAYDIGGCVLSRFPIKRSDPRPRTDVWERGGSGAIALYEIEAPFGTFWVENVHLATVREGLGGFRHFGLGGISTMRENTELRRWESGLASEWTKRAEGPLFVAGDFNMTRESAVYQEAFGAFGDAWETCGLGFGYSKETRVRGIEFGTRIDHVLFDRRFACASAKLAPEIGSDHRGILVELRLR